MLAPLDNETIFKMAFTDKVVFEQFIKDIIGIDFVIGKIETEKRFKPKVSHIDIKLDIFAESKDKRVIIEIQKIAYDYNFDRFLNYFLAAIIEQQKSSKDYSIPQTVYGIVIFTEPYKINQITGQPIKDEVLIQKLDPENLHGNKIKLFGHQQIFLNPNNRNAHTPQNYHDWLDLIYQSIHQASNYQLNEKNKGIKRAIELIEYDNLDTETITQMKNDESMKEKKVVDENDTIKKTTEKFAIKCIKKGMSNSDIIELTELSNNEIDKLRKELKKVKGF